MRFAEKRVLVTGGGSGIGAATARRLTEEGAAVIVVGRREEALRSTGMPFVVADITDAGDRASLQREVGDIDVLVNNAGLFSDDWDVSLAINAAAPRALVAAFADALCARRGNVVNVASIGGMVAASGAGPYAASKAALLMLTRSLAVEYGPVGVRVNAVSPGWVRTPMADADMAPLAAQLDGGLDPAYRAATAHVPLRRAGSPDEIASAVAFLASADASFVTGANLVVDGGSTVVDVGMLAFEPSEAPS